MEPPTRPSARLLGSVTPDPTEPRCVDPSPSSCSCSPLLAGALGRAPPALPRPPRYPGQGRHRRRRDARRDRELSAIRRRGLRRGHQVHAERRQGLQPERHLVEGQGDRGRRVDRHLLRPRQRLAEPVHLRPEVHDQGRLRASTPTERRRRAVRQREQVLRRALRQDPRPGPERHRAAPSPVLCVGQLRARPRAARPSTVAAPADRATTRPGFLQSSAQAVLADGHRGPGRLHPRAVHHRPDDRGDVADRAEQQRSRQQLHLDADQRASRSLMDPEGSSSGFYRSLVTDPTLTTNAGDRRRRHQPRPVDAGRARPGFGPRRGRATVARRGDGRRRRARHEHAHAARHSLARTRPADADGRRRSLSSRSRGSTTRPSTG